jgi:hypothetical protein
MPVRLPVKCQSFDTGWWNSSAAKVPAGEDFEFKLGSGGPGGSRTPTAFAAVLQFTAPMLMAVAGRGSELGAPRLDVG